jgi:hypothetical protein
MTGFETTVGHSNDVTELRNLMTSSEWHVFSSEQFKHLEKQNVGYTRGTDHPTPTGLGWSNFQRTFFGVVAWY